MADGSMHTAPSTKTAHTGIYIMDAAPAAPAEEDMVVMAASSTLTRVSEFFRGMWQRGVGERPSTGLSGSIQRLIPHRFRPHFVNTSKGLRNIPHQLNDGQLQLAPEDAPTSNGAQTIGGSAGATTKPPGSSGPIGSLFNSFKRKLKAIYPGTVWCGDGNQAKSEDDIGFFYLTDSCCRAHDLCPITIAAGEQFNRLKNNGHFTRSHCDCDKKFYNCLKNANTLVSRQIGYTYFNLLKPQCFRHEHPKLNCTKRSRGKCLTYVVDETQPKQWQWFDNLIY
ncbi:AGAP000166-PA-like protein [Anopheles sinensis]|uniref:Phospholipase A2 n=1 Tax=Anopheles sinensis TaxID=74873 RepID=A0A084VQD6_ANOSI|nr:AGAP000166-PA-like protein [Anopheles sinensis]